MLWKHGPKKNEGWWKQVMIMRWMLASIKVAGAKGERKKRGGCPMTGLASSVAKGRSRDLVSVSELKWH